MIIRHYTSANSHTHLYIYYQNVRGLRTKASDLLAGVYSSNFHVICLNETWLNDSCFNCSFFPGTFLVCRSGRLSVEKTFSDYFNLLIGYRYFAPDTTADTLTRYFGCLEHVFDAHNFRVRLGDFIVPYLCSNGNLVCLLLFLTAVTN